MSLFLDRVEILKKYNISKINTGSSIAQILFFSERIEKLKRHFLVHKGDNHSRRGLLKIISKRKRQLRYLKIINLELYKSLVKDLKLRY